MTKRDMHVHTTYSDCSLQPAEVAALASRLKIGELAITDHDTMAGCTEALEAGKAFGVSVIPGVEISAYDFERGRKVHLLGYGIRDMESLESACRPFLQSRHHAQLEALDKVIEAGYPLARESVLRYTGPAGTLYRQHIMHALVDRGYATAIYGDLYRKLFSKDGIAFVRSKYMDVFEALRLIRATGGVAALAHPFQYDSIDLLPELASRGLQGLEVWSSKHSPVQIEALRELASVYSLERCAGSDFHGFYGETINPLGNHHEE